MPRRLLLLLSLVVALGAPPVAPAIAQNGVTVDPDSPTGKEYAIPLDQARREASPGGGGQVSDESSSDGNAPAPLFGAGVGDDSDSGSGRGSDKPKSGSGKPQKNSTQSPSNSTTVQEAIAGTRPVSATIPDGGLGDVMTIVAVALAVLLLGGVLGSIARRRSPSQ